MSATLLTFSSVTCAAMLSIAALAQTQPAPLKPLDQGVADTNVLSTSFRDTWIDLRMPTGFQNVYRVPGQPNMLMRSSGALYAVFPNSSYVRSPLGPLATIPAGTVFYIGLPPELVQDDEDLIEEDFPPGSVQTHITTRQNTRMIARLETALDTAITEDDDEISTDVNASLPPGVRHVLRETPDATTLIGPTVANDSQYRTRRVAELIERARVQVCGEIMSDG